MPLSNYSPAVKKALEKKGIAPGDIIRIEGNAADEGMLLPRSSVGDPDCIVIKRKDGYNIGVRLSAGNRIELVEKPRNRKESLPSIEFDSKMPVVSLISVGGTIASKIDYRTGGVYGLMKPQEILANMPELRGFVNVRMSSPFTKMSEDFDPAEWQELAKAVHKELLTDSQGVVVTHGTDTLHYTAAALSFMLPNLNKPVVLTGSQKSRDRGSSDAGMNIICSMRAAVSGIAEVGICMHASLNDDCCFFIRGTKVRKMDTVRRDAFRPVNDLPIARVWPDGKIEDMGSYRKRSESRPGLKTGFEDRIAILKVYPGSDPHVIDYYVGRGCKGFVLEATALGHVPTAIARKPWIPAIKRCSEDGIPFVITSQCIYGRLNPNVYTNLRLLYHDAGAICGQDMTTETAYVKLGWVLAQAREMAEIRRLMQANIAGEITERTLPGTFLY